MAKIKYILQSQSSNAPIYARFSVGANKVFKRKTQETISPDYWNSRKGKTINVKQSAVSTLIYDTILEIQERLTKLGFFITSQYNGRKDDDTIDGRWLEKKILAFYNDGKTTSDLDYIHNYLEHYKNFILPFRKYKGRPISLRTKQKHLTIISKFTEFLNSENTRLKVSDYNVKVGNRFVTFLRQQNLNDNTVGKYLKYTKTIFNDARSEDIEIHEQLQDIKGFTVETPTHRLDEDELAAIENLELESLKLEDARDWLIIGCNTGQRASDFFRMTEKKIIVINKNEYINLSQVKGKQNVLVPINKTIRRILDKRNGKFPPLFSENIDSSVTIINKHIKAICALAGIIRLDYGRVYDKDKKCYVFGNYPFHLLASSHICRRTFSTMYYTKLPTPVIMSITGHKSEKEFLGYIGIDDTTLPEQMHKYWETLDNEIRQ